RNQLWRQQTGQRDRGQRFHVEFGDRAFVFDGNGDNSSLGQLSRKATQLLGELHIGDEAFSLLGGQRLHMVCVLYRSREQKNGHLLGDLQSYILLRLGRRRAEMRGRNDGVAPEQRVIEGWLLDEHVEGGTGDMAAVERRSEVALNDQAAPRAIDEANPGLHLR